MSDGQFSSKPMWSGKRTDITATASSGANTYSSSEARDFAQSASVRHEVDALREEPYLDLRRIDCTPFPRGAPNFARKLGEPIASAVLVQEYLIGLVFLRAWGWVFIAVGLMIALGSGIAAINNLLGRENPRIDDLIGNVIYAAIGLGVAAVGAWFGIFRGRVINERCWFCPHGMVWMTEKVFEGYQWEDIPEVYARLDSDRPAVGIRFDGPISWISFSGTQSSRMIVHYIENRASAAWLPAALDLLAEGKLIRFGDWRMDRFSLESREQSLTWTKVAEVKARSGEIVFSDNGGRVVLSMWLDEVPLSSLFTVLAKALVAHTREQRV